ncbi:MAG: PilN domain-containing protein [Gammaproteobacteria bacterium]
MARINLLPWREELRKQRRQEFGAAIGLALLGTGLLWLLVYFYYGQRIDYQGERNAFLESQISQLDKKIKEIDELEKEKARLLARMRAIEELQTSRPVVVHLFDEIVNTLPDGVYIKELNQQADVITIRGVARSNARVSNFMRNIDQSQWLTNPQVSIIETKEVQGRRISDFTLTVKQKAQKPVDDEAAAKGTGGKTS